MRVPSRKIDAEIDSVFDNKKRLVDLWPEKVVGCRLLILVEMLPEETLVEVAELLLKRRGEQVVVTSGE